MFLVSDIELLPVLEKIVDNSNMIIFTHLKGHTMHCFWGSLNNLAIICIMLTGQKTITLLAKHLISKIICLVCTCEKACAEDVIHVDNFSQINQKSCISCNVCIKSSQIMLLN